MKRRSRRHLIARVLFFFAGIVLFYAPFAFLVRGLLWFAGSNLVSDAHRICLRMPFEWLSQPWMYSTLVSNPLYLIGPVLLPIVAAVWGPLFCGWLCPAGAMPELVGRLVPRRFKITLQGKLNPSPIRYGVLMGMLISPFAGGYICCTFCNFAMMQNLVSALFGSFEGMLAWASFTIATFVIWFFVLGIFVEGGRGWCNLICPAGAAMGLAHALGHRWRHSRAIRLNEERCIGCRRCTNICPALAINRSGRINYHACTGCQDCVHHCPVRALAYKTPTRANRDVGKTNS